MLLYIFTKVLYWQILARQPSLKTKGLAVPVPGYRSTSTCTQAVRVRVAIASSTASFGSIVVSRLPCCQNLCFSLVSYPGSLYRASAFCVFACCENTGYSGLVSSPSMKNDRKDRPNLLNTNIFGRSMRPINATDLLSIS